MFRTLTIASLLSATLAAQGAGMSPSRTVESKDEAASMVDRIGARIDRNLTFTDERGYPFSLQQLFPGERPVILLLGYYSCPAMCGQVLDATLRALNEVALEPGTDYYLLNVSIDPSETPAIAKQRKETFLPRFTKAGADSGWRVCVGDETAVQQLADQAGFRYYWAEQINQYAHPPAIVFLTKEGVISRQIVNTVYEPADIRLALVEASEGTLGDFWDEVRLNCLTFDPRTSSYTLTVMSVLRIGGALTILALATMIFVLVRRERRRNPAQLGTSAALSPQPVGAQPAGSQPMGSQPTGSQPMGSAPPDAGPATPTSV